MKFLNASLRVAPPDPASLAGAFSLPFWLVVLWLLLAGNTLPAQETPSEYQVKAAFLYNFGKFVQWPAHTFANGHAPLVIGVFGDDPFHGDLERIVAGKNVAGHPVQVRYVSSPSELKGCEIVFVSKTEHEAASGLAEAIQGFGILTVTEDTKHFAGSGYIISFITVDDSIRFEINNAAAVKAGLDISSKLLALAKTPEN